MKYIIKIHLYTATLLTCLSFFVSCKKPSLDQPNYMAFENVAYITEFPETFMLRDRKVPDVDIIGLRSFAIYDTVMVLHTTDNKGLWSLYSLPDYRYLGRYINRGEGPMELMQGPHAIINTQITSKRDQLLAYLYDFQKGRLLQFNISESVNSGESHVSEMNDALPPYLFVCVMIDSSTFFIKELDNKDTQQIRYLYKNGHKTTSPILDKLNAAYIMEGEDFNILSAITKLSDYHDRFVEMPIGLNYINLYSLNGTFAKTLCIGENLFDVSSIQKESEWDRIYTFSDLRVFDDFFGVVFINEGMQTYQTNRTKLPSILLFDWKGEPLAELKLENHITSFDIDFFNKKLYTFDVHSDELIKYDIDDILSKLKSNS